MTTRTAPKKAARRKAPAKKKATQRKAAPAKAATKTAKKKPDNVGAKQEILVSAPNYSTLLLHIVGTGPLMVNAFSRRRQSEWQAQQEAGDAGKQRKKPKVGKDFDREYREAKHVSSKGWEGVHAASFRNAMISACRVVGATMTKAKLAIWTIEDGYDAQSAEPLVRLYGKPRMDIRPVRIKGTPDLRSRPLYESWKLKLKLEFDEDVFSLESVYNLIVRAGAQVGIGEGRPDGKEGNGIGFGRFKVVNQKDW